MFIGGEFYEDAAWVTQPPTLTIKEGLFLNGGRACLSVINRYLAANNINHILLPEYLCPSILDVLEQHGLKYSFYRINDDFSIDLDDLLCKAVHHQVVYFINYFGFEHSSDTLSALSQLQANGMIIIEDNAQAGFPQRRIGDFCFNSMRKFCAYDGGFLTTRNIPLSFLNYQDSHTNNRLPLIREYRRGLRSYLFEGRGSREDLERLFYRAEDYYEHDGVIIGDIEEQKNIEQLDWQAIKTVRRNNYSYLLNQIVDLPFIHPIYPALQIDNMPLGFPVYIFGYSRDGLINLLADNSISLTVHWDVLLTDPRTKNNHRIAKMAGHILTLPVDQYTSISQLDYLLDHLVNTFSNM